MRKLPYPLALLAALGVFWVGRMVVVYRTDCSVGGTRSSQTEAYQAWSALIGIGIALGVLLAGFLWRRVRTIRKSNQHIRPRVAAMTVAFMLVASIVPTAAARTVVAEPLYGSNAQFCNLGTRTAVIVTAFSLLLIPGVVLLDYIRQVARAQTVSTSFDVRQHLELRRHLEVGTSSLALLLTIALLGVATLRSAVLAAGGEFGEMRLVLFGLQYSVILLLLYWPAATELDRVARQQIEQHHPLPSISSPDFAEVADTRTRIASALGARTSPLRRLQSQASIAAPLVISLVSAAVTG